MPADEVKDGGTATLDMPQGKEGDVPGFFPTGDEAPETTSKPSEDSNFSYDFPEAGTETATDLPDDSAAPEESDAGQSDSAPTFDDTLLDYAARLGIPPSEARRFSSPDALQRVLIDRATREQELMRQSNGPPAQQPEQTKPADEPLALNINFDEQFKDFDPALRDAMKSVAGQMQTAFGSELKNLRAQYANLEAAANQQRQMEFQRTVRAIANDFEDWVQSQPEEWRGDDVLGSQRERELDPNGSVMKARLKTLKTAIALRDAVAPNDPNLRPYFEQAAWATYGPKIVQAKQKALSTNLKKTAKRFTNPPNGRQITNPLDQGRAILDAKMRELGLDPRTGRNL